MNDPSRERLTMHQVSTDPSATRPAGDPPPAHRRPARPPARQPAGGPPARPPATGPVRDAAVRDTIIPRDGQSVRTRPRLNRFPGRIICLWWAADVRFIVLLPYVRACERTGGRADGRAVGRVGGLAVERSVGRTGAQEGVRVCWRRAVGGRAASEQVGGKAEGRWAERQDGLAGWRAGRSGLRASRRTGGRATGPKPRWRRVI